MPPNEEKRKQGTERAVTELRRYLFIYLTIYFIMMMININIIIMIWCIIVCSANILCILKLSTN